MRYLVSDRGVRVWIVTFRSLVCYGRVYTQCYKLIIDSNCGIFRIRNSIEVFIMEILGLVAF